MVSAINITEILIWAIPVVLAITVHEAAHGYAARHFGDPTADLAGRITLNPLRHVDPMGTVAVPLGLFLLSSSLGHAWVFGWAKPVPVDFNKLHHPKADMLWVAAAGPFANLLMAVGWALIYALFGSKLPLAYVKMALAGMSVNGILMFLNLLPIPPLDGGRIVVSLLPHSLAWKFARLEPFGFPILLLLMATGYLGEILMQLETWFVGSLKILVGA